MKKPVFCINRLRYFRTIIFAANSMFAILCLLTLFPFADSTNRASAEVNGDEYALTLGMTSDISFTINPTTEEAQGGALNVAKATIVGGTNAPTGYQLYISSAEDDNSFLLEGEEGNTARDDSRMQATTGTIAAPEALFTSQSVPATWGFAVPGIGGFDEAYTTSSPSTSAKFAAVPTAGNGQLIHEATTAIDNDSFDVYFATKVNSRLRHGKYTTWIKYSAVTDMASEVAEGISIFPRRIRNNYEPGTTITITSETRIASDLGILIATVNNQPCENIIKITDSPLVITCEIPDNLENGEYDVALNIPQYGKSFNSAEKLKIVDPYDTMQEIDKEIYDSVLTEQQYQFIDSRDDKKYYVTKLKNGDLYMTQNLDFELSTEGTTLYPETSDVETEKTIAKTPSELNSFSNVAKISRTLNFTEDGNRTRTLQSTEWYNTAIRGTDRDEESSDAHVITIPGASELNIDIYYGSYASSYYSGIGLWAGAHPSFTTTSYTEPYKYLLGKYCYDTYSINGYSSNYLCKETYSIEGDTVTIALGASYHAVNWTNNYFSGYYAIVTADGVVLENEQTNNPDLFFQERDLKEYTDAHQAGGSVYSISTALTQPITDTMTSNESICPKGWKLDDYTDYNNSISGLYGNTSRGNGTIDLNVNPHFIVNGNFLGSNFSSLSVTKKGKIKTNSSTSDAVYQSILDGENQFGYVRCVFEAPQRYSINFDANGGSNAPEEQLFGGWENNNSHTFQITSSTPSREDSTFLGWSENSNAPTGEYQPGDSYVATGQHTLYAIWSNVHNYFDDAFEAAGKTKTNGYYAMQDMTEEICAAVPKKISEFEANETQLIDLRDNKIYFVSKLQDGRCWMTQNLNFELDANGTTLDPATSSVAAERTIAATDFDEEHQDYYQGFGTLMKNDFYGSVDISDIVTSLNDPLFHYLLGSAYTFPSATALADKTNVTFTSETSGSTTSEEETQEEESTPDSFNLTQKYSYTSNFAEDGTMLSSGSVLWNNSTIRGTGRTEGSSSRHTVTFPGATSLQVKIYYYANGSSNYVDIYNSYGSRVQRVYGTSCSGTTLFGQAMPNFCSTTVSVYTESVSFELYGSTYGRGGYYAIMTPLSMENGEGGQDYYPPSIEPVKQNTSVAHSRTQNLDATGRMLSEYGNSWNSSHILGTNRGDTSQPHTVCLSGYDYLSIVVYTGKRYYNDGVGVYIGSDTSKPAYLSSGGYSNETYDINGNLVSNIDRLVTTIPGNCATFTWYSSYNSSSYGGNGYGYYATIKGGYFSYGSKKKMGTKYSYTGNINQNGEKIADYGSHWGNSNILGSTRGDSNNAHVVTISGASLLLVDVFYSTKSATTDYVSVWSGSAGSYNAKDNYGSSLSGKLGGVQYGNYSLNGKILNNMGHKQYIISGNSATFGFTSSDENAPGNGYGYYAIVTGYSDNITTTTHIAKQPTVQESICPKGWRLPHVQNASNNELSKLIPEGNYTDAAKRRYFTNQPLFYTDTDAPINYINDNSIEPLISTLSNNYSHDDAAPGFVRCVAEETYPFSIIFNTGDDDATAPANIYALFTDSNTKSIMIPNKDISYPGHKFLGWTSDASSDVVEYLPGMYYTFNSSSVELHAVWHNIETFAEAFEMMEKTKVDGEHYAMQDMTEQICGLIPAYNGTLITETLIDTRDNKLYTVSKLKDNHCWMIQDLAFMTGEGVTLNPSTSNVEKEISASVAPIVNENGVYYTYEAATAGFGRGLKTLITGDNLFNLHQFNNSAEATNTICPKGWTLPYSFSGTYGFTGILKRIEGQNAFEVAADFAPSQRGVWDTSTSEPTYINTTSGYWGSTLGQLGEAFSLSFDGNSMNIVATPRKYAMGVRCIATESTKGKPSLYNLGTLQGITPELVAAGGFAEDVIDERDEGKDDRPLYTVYKANDGRAWMTTSLRYEHEDGAILDPYTSDVPEPIAFSAEGPNSYYVATPHNKYYAENRTTIGEREIPSYYSGETTGGFANVYDYNTSTMGYYYTFDYATVNNHDGSSICPAGWQLPTSDMMAQYAGSSYSYMTNGSSEGLRMNWTQMMNLGGYYTGAQGDEYSDPEHAGDEGFFWTSTRISNRNARGMWFSPTASNASYPMARNVAGQVRCVSK